MQHLDHDHFLVPTGKKVTLDDYPCDATPGIANKAAAEDDLDADRKALSEAQSVLWASAEYSVMIILQAMDAAGKDGTIKHVMSGLNPQGVEVHSFKAPNSEELLQPFLWRPLRVMPARGRIALFNRSYYEETLVVRVHPEFLDAQRLPESQTAKGIDKLWESRYNEINTMERWWTNNNMLVLKFFLHVSREEQKKRFLERIDDPEKHWKFNSGDIRERGYWNEYMRAYEQMLAATSTEYAPWHVIPADKKWYARAAVADVITKRINELKLEYPKISASEKAKLAESRASLMAEKD